MPIPAAGRAARHPRAALAATRELAHAQPASSFARRAEARHHRCRARRTRHGPCAAKARAPPHARRRTARRPGRPGRPPFVGPAGQLLDRALAQLGIGTRQGLCANAVKHFKYELRGKRRIHKTPTQREAEACSHWLEDEIAGATRAAGRPGRHRRPLVAGQAVPVMANRGQMAARAREDGRKVLVTLHPSALLRVPPPDRDAAYRDWLHDLSRINPH
jgi:uracil-DNA glycosylase family 4